MRKIEAPAAGVVNCVFKTESQFTTTVNGIETVPVDGTTIKQSAVRSDVVSPVPCV